jgi:hypothetical protein
MAATRGKASKSKPTWIDVKQKIAAFDRAGLIHLISDLYAMNPENKAFLHARFQLGESPLDGYKQRIRSAVSPDTSGTRIKDPSVSNARRVISEYKKAVGDVIGLQELRLCWCESAVEFAMSCGFEDEGYFEALIRQYRDACQALVEAPESSRQEWLDKLRAIRDQADMGYGVQDEMNYWLAETDV